MASTAPYEIELVSGWSIDLREQPHAALRWKATAIRDGEFEYSEGVDRAMALVNIAHVCGIDGHQVLSQFGH